MQQIKMNSFMNMVKIQNQEREYPCKMGERWNDDEEALLLEELNKNIDIETIAQAHNRTVGGINSRRQEIAYRMFLKNVSMEEIISQTKLDHESITKTIEKRQFNNKKNNGNKKTISVESEIAEMKHEIKELKNTVKELVDLIKAVYEFEDA